jgi:exopolyphosphatase / guanosine-5'-triphosphate,3'-diphosphate pyrophosphatase
VAEKVLDMQSAVVAAIDIGTNSVHMVIAHVDQLGFHIITAEKEVVRLGAGSGGFEVLTEEAMGRGLVALRRMKQIAGAHSALVRAVATSAVREAENGDEFVRRARDEVGVEIRVISGSEEARLIALGVRRSLSFGGDRVLMIDIGGGSTEFTISEGHRTHLSQSLKLGAVRLTDKFLAEKVGGSSVAKLRAYANSTFAPLANDIRKIGFSRVVLSSGTCETLVRASLIGDGREPSASLNGKTISRHALNSLVDQICDCDSIGEISEIPGIDSKRAEIITAGAVLLQEYCRALKVDSCEFSEFALREGVLFDAAEQLLGMRLSRRDAARDGALRFARRCSVDVQHSEHVARISSQIFSTLHRHFELDEGLLPLLETAAILSNVGASISYSRHHLHSYYMIRNADLVGFSDDDIELIALVARYHRKGNPKRSHPEYEALSEGRRHDVDLLAGILRIATGLDRSHDQCVTTVRGAVVADAEEELVELKVIGLCDSQETLDLNLFTAQERTSLLEDFLGMPVRLVGSLSKKR